jgi:hypothetical protein
VKRLGTVAADRIVRLSQSGDRRKSAAEKRR